MEVSLISSSISPESGESFLKCFRKAKGARLVASSPMRAHGRRAKMLRRLSNFKVLRSESLV